MRFVERGYALSCKTIGFSDNLPGCRFFKIFCNSIMVLAYQLVLTVDSYDKNSMRTDPCILKKGVIMILPTDVFVCTFVILGETLCFQSRLAMLSIDIDV